MSTMMVNLTFGEWLKDQLEERDMEQQDLAAMIGANSSTVSKWIKGTNRPYAPTCLRIAETLKVDPEEVLRRAKRTRRQAPPGVGLSHVDVAGFEAKFDEVLDRIDRLTDEVAKLRERDDDHK